MNDDTQNIGDAGSPGDPGSPGGTGNPGNTGGSESAGDLRGRRSGPGAQGPDPARPASDPWPVEPNPLVQPGTEQPVDVGAAVPDGLDPRGPVPDGPNPPGTDPHDTDEIERPSAEPRDPHATGQIELPETAQTNAYTHSRRPRTLPMDAAPDDDFDPIDEPLYTPSSLGSVVRPTVAKSSPSRNRTGRTVMLVSLVMVLVLVIAGLSIELYSRSQAQKAASCLEKSLQAVTGTPVHVRMSGPFITAFFTKKVSWITAETTRPVEDGAMELNARADDVSTDGGAIGSLTGDGFLPYDRAEHLALSRKSTVIRGFEGRSTRIVGDGSSGRIDVAVAVRSTLLDRDVMSTTVHLKPETTDGKVILRVESIDSFVLSSDLVKPFVQDIVDDVTEGLFGPLFTQVAVTELNVRDDGVKFAFAGKSVDVGAMSRSADQNFSCV